MNQKIETINDRLELFSKEWYIRLYQSVETDKSKIITWDDIKDKSYVQAMFLSITLEKPYKRYR